MIITIPKDIYPKIAVLKAAYHFTDKAYIYIQQSDTDYLINYKPKVDCDSISADEFTNELLSQAVRYMIYNQTKDVRKLIAMRALATTIVGEAKEIIEPQTPYTEDEILKDWFENENT